MNCAQRSCDQIQNVTSYKKRINKQYGWLRCASLNQKICCEKRGGKVKGFGEINLSKHTIVENCSVNNEKRAYKQVKRIIGKINA